MSTFREKTSNYYNIEIMNDPEAIKQIDWPTFFIPAISLNYFFDE